MFWMIINNVFLRLKFLNELNKLNKFGHKEVTNYQELIQKRGCLISGKILTCHSHENGHPLLHNGFGIPVFTRMTNTI
jgi:hypothetical protein